MSAVDRMLAILRAPWLRAATGACDPTVRQPRVIIAACYCTADAAASCDGNGSGRSPCACRCHRGVSP